MQCIQSAYAVAYARAYAENMQCMNCAYAKSMHCIKCAMQKLCTAMQIK